MPRGCRDTSYHAARVEVLSGEASAGSGSALRLQLARVEILSGEVSAGSASRLQEARVEVLSGDGEVGWRRYFALVEAPSGLGATSSDRLA